ncbi:hypothetical protein SAMN05446635_2907 [Burkholderia sp. OK233]|nr:hypothetical protein SAMN05446635_2907 [Burkholderia sp. OK233]
MFRMLPKMSLGRRLAVWWSCLWRQLLATLPLWGLGLGLAAIWVFQRDRGQYPSIATVLIALAVVAPICFVVCLPFIGYTVRRGFIAQRLTAPDRLTFWQAVMVGLTTAGWTIVASIPVNLAMSPFSRTSYALPCELLGLVIQAAAALYVVLPRQARRLRLLSGATW